MIRRAAAAALASSASVLMVSCVYPTRPIPWDIWLPPRPPQYEVPLERKLELIEKRMLDRHLSPEGVLIYERTDRPFEPDQPGGYKNLAGEADWTGAADGFRSRFPAGLRDGVLPRTALTAAFPPAVSAAAPRRWQG